jgi:hypothetical protein
VEMPVLNNIVVAADNVELMLDAEELAVDADPEEGAEDWVAVAHSSEVV